LPRDLGDVLDYFLPTPERTSRSSGERSVPRASPTLRVGRERASGRPHPAALPIVAVPMGERDVVRAAFAWNLAVEVARQGASASLVAPEGEEPGLLWPEPGRGPLGSEVVLAAAGGLGELYRAALDIAVARAADCDDGGVVLVRVPFPWLRQASDGRRLLRWVLLFASMEPRDLLETYDLAKRVLGTGAENRVGITIHGARHIGEAEQAFQLLAGVAARHLHRSLVSYGLLVDDLHVYRAIVSRRPIGLERPQSRAARALRDVARMLLEDAWKIAVA
jgi:hypothetical protein